jgi:hypothetical protein
MVLFITPLPSISALFVASKAVALSLKKDYYLVLFFRFVYDLCLSLVELFHRNILTACPSKGSTVVETYYPLKVFEDGKVLFHPLP